MAKRNRIGSLIDNGVAALAAVGTGFATFAMPDELFEKLVVSSHLPDFVAAAQPPLGGTARLGAVAIVAIIAYAFVWTLLRALDSVGRAAPRPVAPQVLEAPEAPKLRRADAHPDAPARAPLLAGRDLGEPAFDSDEPEFRPEAPAAEAPKPLPSFLVPQPELEVEPEPEPESQPEPVFEAEAPAEEPVAEVEEPAEPAGQPAREESEEGLGKLMQRFESGLSRKQQALPTLSRAPVDTDSPAVEADQSERVGHRLRSAISDLNRLSAHGG